MNERQKFFVSFFLLLYAFVLPSSAVADTIYVKADAVGADNGTSWFNAFNDLQSALGDADIGDEIWVAAGIYTPGTNRSDSFRLNSGIALYGGFSGTENNRNQRNVTGNPTILTGDIGVYGDNSDNSYHVVYADGVDNTVVLDGFTITGGNSNADDYSVGGGMYNYHASPIIKNCVFIRNSASFWGGGIYNRFSNPTIENCTFTENSARLGGGIYNRDGNPIIENCLFSDNSAVSSGGGMYNRDSNPTTEKCIFSGNIGDNQGGGIYNITSSPVVRNCTFSRNAATDDYYGHGGGIYIKSGNPIVEKCTFSENSANYGGGIFNDANSLTVSNCTFSGNSATSEGGGIINESHGLVLMNCTFSANTASEGDGLFNRYGIPSVANSIFWGTNSPTGQLSGEGIGSVTYSITEVPGVGNINNDPKLGPLADNGGLTKTHALLAGSSALDNGTSVGAPETDQRGVSRPQGGGIDIGAFEMKVGGSGSGGCSAGGPLAPSVLLLLAPLALIAAGRKK